MHVIFEGQSSLYRGDLIDVVAARLMLQGNKCLVTRHPGSPYDAACVKTRGFLKGSANLPDSKLFLYLADIVQHEGGVARPFLARTDGVILQNKGVLSVLINFVLSERDPVRSVVRRQVIESVFNFVRPADLLVLCVSAYPGPRDGKISLRKWSKEAYRVLHNEPTSLSPFIGTVANEILRVEVNFASELGPAADSVVSEINRLRGHHAVQE